MKKVYKIHLSDKLSQCFPISKYIESRVYTRNKDLYEQVEETFSRTFDRIFKNFVGKNWKEITTKYSEEVNFVNYTYTSDDIKSYLNSAVDPSYLKGGYVLVNYTTRASYPWHPGGLIDKITIKENHKVSKKIIDILELKFRILGELFSCGIINSSGYYINPGKTWGDIKSLYPDLLEWEMETKLKDYDRGEIISKKEDLEELKRWIPEVMI